MSHRSECPNVPAITPTRPPAYLTCQVTGGLPSAPLPRAKVAREGYRQNRAMNAGTAADFGPLSLKTHQWQPADFRQLQPLRGHLFENGVRLAIGRNLCQLQAMSGEGDVSLSFVD